ncbi:MAG: hypothetical protein K2K10_06945, partial [Acetatifactor sp.]|nr:hypothetical protein [Acetatifactor sp.]
MAESSKGSTTKRASKSKSKIIIFAVEILLILIMLAILFLVMTKGNGGPKVVDLNTENLGINEGVLSNKNQPDNDTPTVEPGAIVDTGYIRRAQFGVDATPTQARFP